MFEQQLSMKPYVGLPDNSELPFPAGTPFKGVVRSNTFITGEALATAIGLTVGTAKDGDAGWLHFIAADTGMEFYIAKKTMRYNVSWEQLSTAQANKEITINGDVYVCQFITGMTGPNLAVADSTAGGLWNKYMYPLYSGDRYTELPAGTPVWGSYNAFMLGLPAAKVSQDPGVHSICAEAVTNGGHATRGVTWTNSDVPNIMGLWYVATNTPQTWYGWRPMLVKKSTLPPSVYRGQVAASAFITPSALSTLVSYSFGTLMDDATPWLHFIEDNGKEVYVAQKSLRDKCTRASLNTAGLGNTANGKLVTIGGKNYKCRLLTEAEWNRYMYGVYDNSVVTVNTLFWASFTPTNLTVGSNSVVAGGLTHTFDGTTRGYPNISGAWATNDGSPGTSGYAWRPILELVP